jgi:hypothetical protein
MTLPTASQKDKQSTGLVMNGSFATNMYESCMHAWPLNGHSSLTFLSFEHYEEFLAPVALGKSLGCSSSL